MTSPLDPNQIPSVVIDSSPLIFLTKVDRLSLLQALYGEVLLPREVLTEIEQHGTVDLTVQAIDRTPWLILGETPPIPEWIRAYRLGSGESSVISWAFTHLGIEAILDDLAARRRAESLGIPVRGTLGLILISKQRGLIPLARPVLEELRRVGMFLSDAVIVRKAGHRPSGLEASRGVVSR